MKKSPQHRVVRIVDAATLAYKYLLGFFAVTVIVGVATGDMQTFAATGGGFSEFNAYICRLRLLIGTIIGGIAVLMIIIAGIMYAMSGGSDKGTLSMSSAKNMIMSAITGVVFYMLSDALLGNCMGGDAGGLLGEIFR